MAQGSGALEGGGVAPLALARPEVRNAYDEQMTAEPSEELAACGGGSGI